MKVDITDSHHCSAYIYLIVHGANGRKERRKRNWVS